MKQTFTCKALFFTLLATLFSVAISFGQTAITTGTLDPASVCVGGNVSVPFTTTGVVAPLTSFVAQLSDATGAFGSPTEIGSAAATPITATIPTGTAAGSAYKIRVISVLATVTVAEGSASATALTVNAIPAAPGVTTPVTYVQNAAATALDATGAGLLWYKDATGGTGSATKPVPSTTTVGTTSYYVSQTVTGCESPRSKIEVTVSACTPPSAPTVADKTYIVGDAATALTATPADGLLWYMAATGGTGDATAPTPTTAAAGTKSYWVSRTVNGCESERAKVTITVNACTPPAAPTVADKTYTVGDPAAALSATPTDGLLWYTAATGGTGSGTAPTPSTAAVGTKSYWVSRTVSGCESDRAEIKVTVNACTPPAKPTVSNKSYTVGDAATALTATPTDGLLWYTAATGGTGSATAPTPSTATAGTKSYWVSRSVSGCESERVEIVVTVSACTPPAKPTVSNKSYTVGDAATPLTATPTDGLLWYTSATGGTGSATAPTPSTTAAGTKSYWVSRTVNSCESERAEIVVTVSACTPPAKPTVSNKSYTVGDAATALSATPTSGLLWYTSASGGTGSATAPTPSTATVGTKSYWVSRTVNNCESERAEIVVTVSACTPPAKPTVSDRSYNRGDAATALTATPSDGLLWYTSATGGTGSTIAPIPSTATAGTRSYWVSRTVNNCESERAEIVVTVNACPATIPLPTVSTPLNICQGTTATALTATPTNSTYTLKWYTTATGGTGSATLIPSTTMAGTTSYYVSQTTAAGCESARVKIDVIVKDTPAAPTVANVPYCVGVTATALTPSGGLYKWYTVATGGTGTSTGPIPSTTTAGTTSYYLTQSNTYTINGATLSCESTRTKVDVVVSPTPANLTALSEAYCQTRGDSTYTFPTKAADGNTLNWYTAASGGTGSATTPTVNAKTAGEATFYVTQKSAKNCESPARAAQKVRIKKLPNVPTIEKPSIEYCQFIKVDPLTATPVTNATLNWYNSQTGGSASSTAPTPSTAEGGTTSYFVAQTLEGCTSDRAKIDVKINTTPVPETKTALAYCQNEVAPRLEATGNVLKWYRSADATEFQGVPFTPFTEKVQDYSFFVTQTGAANGCESPKQEIKIHIKSLPSATISGNSTIDLGSTANINIKFTGDGPWIYVLSNGLTDTTNQSNHQVEVKPSTTTSYVVTEVSNACGKGLPIGSALVTVKVPTINSGNPSVAEACAGKTFNVPFQQSGDFPSENTFKVQIAANNEDAQFRTIPSTATNNIVTATFPDTTKGGSYYVRVISSGANADFTIKGSVSAITITASPLPVATLSGAQTILIGQSANLKADITGRSPWTFTLNNGTKDTLITAAATPYTFSVSPKTTSTYTITRVTNGCGIGNGVGSARVQVDPILGIEPPKSADWVKVYPTMIQANCIVEITGTLVPKQASVEVVDLSGRSRAVNVIREKTTEINFSSYPSGLYLLRIKNGDQSTVQRVMKP